MSWSIGENPLFRPRWNKEGRGVAGVVVRVMKYVDRVESAVLGVELVGVFVKLRDTLKGGFARRMEEFGLMKAREVAERAVEWGYGAAERWASDLAFVSYVTLLDVFTPSGWGV